jgi:hypothetical protein
MIDYRKFWLYGNSYSLRHKQKIVGIIQATLKAAIVENEEVTNSITATNKWGVVF